MAPSPTGMFHIGSLRTALYDYLLAKKHQGIFFLRIEDTDRTRLVEGAVANVLDSFLWAGISPDEGVVYDKHGTVSQKGDWGPYVQSERLSIYDTYINQLLEHGFAYYAFDTAEELEAMRQRQLQNKLPPRYDRSQMTNSFTIGIDESKQRIASGQEYVVRMVVPDNERITFQDIIRGEISVHSKEVDEQILRKSDGYPTYHLAVVVDDYLMKTTHVLRGEEWISSTPKHLLLYRYFGWEPPMIGHLPVLVNETGKKLSKRHGDVAVSQYIDKGYLPEAVVNFVALLGWNPGTPQEIFSLEELIHSFDISKVQKKPAFFDIKKLDWFNEQWIRKIDISDLCNRVLPYLEHAGFLKPSIEKNMFIHGTMGTIVTFEWLIELVSLQKDRVTTLAEFPSALEFMFSLPAYDTNLLAWKKSSLIDAKEKLQALYAYIVGIDERHWTKSNIEQPVLEWIKQHDYGVGDVLWPFRVAVSGLSQSPGPFDIAAVLGKAETLERISTAIARIP